MTKTFTAAEVAKHKTPESGLYIIVDSSVYDITNFIEEHPGGSRILKRVAGKDASKQFWKYHGDGVLKNDTPAVIDITYKNTERCVMVTLNLYTTLARPYRLKSGVLNVSPGFTREFSFPWWFQSFIVKPTPKFGSYTIFNFSLDY
ncbi:cytochrome b5 [Trichophyton mentagrophytes]|nr:cytochrome b5 [Trichophyton mentagrophytes]